MLSICCPQYMSIVFSSLQWCNYSSLHSSHSSTPKSPGYNKRQGPMGLHRRPLPPKSPRHILSHRSHNRSNSRSPPNHNAVVSPNRRGPNLADRRPSVPNHTDKRNLILARGTQYPCFHHVRKQPRPSYEGKDPSIFAAFASSGAFSGSDLPSLSEDTKGLDPAFKTYVVTSTMASNGWQIYTGPSYNASGTGPFNSTLECQRSNFRCNLKPNGSAIP